MTFDTAHYSSWIISKYPSVATITFLRWKSLLNLALLCHRTALLSGITVSFTGIIFHKLNGKRVAFNNTFHLLIYSSIFSPLQKFHAICRHRQLLRKRNLNWFYYFIRGCIRFTSPFTVNEWMQSSRDPLSCFGFV